MKISITTTVVNGKLMRNRRLILDALQALESKEITLTIEKKRKTRTSPENRYYFAVVVTLMQDCIKNEWAEIWSKEKCHEFLKSRFLFTEVVNENSGEIARVPKSTTECTVSEFEDYLTECREFMQEWFNTKCPLPNEELTLEL